MANYVFAINGMGSYEAGTGMREDMHMQSFNIFNYQAGVVLSNDLLVTETSPASMAVKVAAGRCFVPNSSYTVNTPNSTKYWGVLVEETTVSVDTNTSGSTRVDLVTVNVDKVTAPNAYATNVSNTIVVKGTPGSGAPALPNNSLLIATLTIPTATTTTITTAMIADSRQYCGTQTPYKNAHHMIDPTGVAVLKTYVDSNKNIIYADKDNHIWKIVVPQEGSITAACTSLDADGESGYGGIIQLMTGLYTVSDTITLPNGAILRGAGKNQTQLRQTSTVTNFISMGGSSSLEDLYLVKSSTSITITNWINLDSSCSVKNVRAVDIGKGNKTENLLNGSPDGAQVQIVGFQFAGDAGASSTVLPTGAAPVYCIFYLTEESGASQHRAFTLGASSVDCFALVRHQGTESSIGTGNTINPT